VSLLGGEEILRLSAHLAVSEGPSVHDPVDLITLKINRDGQSVETLPQLGDILARQLVERGAHVAAASKSKWVVASSF
jgi:hypothetical protein